MHCGHLLRTYVSEACFSKDGLRKSLKRKGLGSKFFECDFKSVLSKLLIGNVAGILNDCLRREIFKYPSVFVVGPITYTPFISLNLLYYSLFRTQIMGILIVFNCTPEIAAFTKTGCCTLVKPKSLFHNAQKEVANW